MLPRAIETKVIDGVAVERVFSYAFKAMTLCLDEFVLAPGQQLVVPRPLTPPNTNYGDELALFVRSEGAVEVRGQSVVPCKGDVIVPVAADHPPVVAAVRGRAAVAAVWAGAKATT